MSKLPYHYIYVAGPISCGDYLMNLRRGILAGVELIRRGYAPFIPHLDYSAYMFAPEEMDYETRLRVDFDWIEKCDGVLRLSGESPGADREVELADSMDIPVFYSMDQLELANGRRPQL